MAEFASPVLGEKRKQSFEHLPRKRIAPERPDNHFRDEGGGESFWMVQWRFPQYKKHKTWDGDAVLVLTGAKGTLYNLDGKFMGTGSLIGPVEIGGEHHFGGREISIDHPISRADYLSGRCFGCSSGLDSTSNPAPAGSSALATSFKPLRTSNLTTPFKAPVIIKRAVIDLEPVDLISTGSSKSQDKRDHWTANWRRPQSKKHKTWDGDVFVSLSAGKLNVISEKGKIIGRKDWDGCELKSGYRFYSGSKEVELDAPVTFSQLPLITGMEVDVHPNADEMVCRGSSPTEFTSTLPCPSSKENTPHSVVSSCSTRRFVPPVSFYGKEPARKSNAPLHDPDAEGAVVMKSPEKGHLERYNKGLPGMPVVLDPIIARHLRPHQIEGVKFMYECVMGMRKHEGQGCILADEMGLGKTLQTIALCWTLLKQSPYGGDKGVIGKALIVCPVSLINNWRAEFRKWLGRDRAGVFTGEKDKSSIKQFINSKIHQVLVIGYEKLRSVIGDLAYCSPPIGLIVCDEGHRLKSTNSKASLMFKALRTPRRIILSGTPIQNDLSEFHAMADFCNPGLLDDYSTFRRVYEVPILKSRSPDCTAKELELGEARSTQLSTISKSFVLRREAEILKNVLPPKHEYVVFVAPTALQLSMFTAVLDAEKLDMLIENSTAESLALINILTKISSSPVLLKAQLDKAKATKSGVIRLPGVAEALKLLPEKMHVEDVSISGKLSALANLLKAIRKYTEEKCIVVSHYTSTLNIIEKFCKTSSYTYLRLDGQTPAAKRQEYVNLFNKSTQQNYYIFLLSSKAGGVGLNLIGASRLCLIDSDWNPSHDLQSMARIHRDGQKRPVFIYRFLTAGTIDEKIYQRQVTKIGLSDSFMSTGGAGSKADSFTRKELRDIFRIHPGTACHTHELLGCGCGGQGVYHTDDSTLDTLEEGDETVGSFMAASQLTEAHLNQMGQTDLKKRAALAALGEWTHINCLRCVPHDDIRDDILRRLLPFVEPTNDEIGELEDADSRLDRLLAISNTGDSSVIDEADFAPFLGDIPGGTISFLFEKITNSNIGDKGDADTTTVVDKQT